MTASGEKRGIKQTPQTLTIIAKLEFILLTLCTAVNILQLTFYYCFEVQTVL